MTRKPISPWLLLATTAQLGFLALDIALDETFTAIFLLPPLALALVERPRPVAAMAALGVVLAVASPVWNDGSTVDGYLLRSGIVALGGFLAVLSAQARSQLAGAQRVSEAVGRRLDAVLGALAEAVTVHDAAGTTVYANEAAVRLLGAESLDEVLAAEPGELASRFIITREDGTAVEVGDFPGRAVVRGREPAPMLTRSVKRSTGEAFWLLTKATDVRDEDGRILAVNIIEDVTEAKEAELRSRFLARATQLLASSLDYDETLQKVAWLAVPTLADWCAVDLSGDDGVPQRVALAHTDPDKRRLGERLQRDYPPDPNAEQGVPAVLRGGDSQLFSEIPDELLVEATRDEQHLKLIRSVGMRSVMVVPMRVGERTVGAMSFVSGESERVFDASDLAFAEDLASRAATAVENARLYSRITDIAQTLQNSLLPDALPQPHGANIVATYHPGERGSEVGGDFYDVFPVDGGWMVVLGDVTGKGVRAAARTALVRHTAKTAARFDPRPAAVCEFVNRVLREQPDLSIVTMVCALLRIDPSGGASVSVTSGGHPLPLRIGPDGAQPVGTHDPLLGAHDGGTWTATECDLEPGETLLFFTDGVTDMPGEEERFGDERLLRLAADGPPGAAAVVERIDSALEAFATGFHADDRALLAVEMVASPVAPSLPHAAPSA